MCWFCMVTIPEDIRTWDDLVDRAPMPDVYYRPAYVRAYGLTGHGRPWQLVIRSGETEALFPLLVRELKSRRNYPRCRHSLRIWWRAANYSGSRACRTPKSRSICYLSSRVGSCIRAGWHAPPPPPILRQDKLWGVTSSAAMNGSVPFLAARLPP